MNLTHTAEEGDTPIMTLRLPIDIGVCAKMIKHVNVAYPSVGKAPRVRTESEIGNPEQKWMVIYQKA